MIPVRQDWEIEQITAAGRILAGLWKELSSLLRPGLSTADLDKTAFQYLGDHGGLPTFKGYRGYPATLCISINQEVVHGIPRPERVLREGDLVGVDVGVTRNDYIADAARTFYIGGSPPPETIKLMAVTRQALEAGIRQARPGNRVSDISRAVQQTVETAGFSVVRDLCGHGVGRRLHEEPEIPNYLKPGPSPRLEAGMVLAIEPMVNAGGHQVKFLSDGWTVVTADSSLSAHFEDTVIVTDGEPLIATR